MARPATTAKTHLFRQMVRTLPCPKCGAAAGQKCEGARGQRRHANHLERVVAFRNLI